MEEGGIGMTVKIAIILLAIAFGVSLVFLLKTKGIDVLGAFSNWRGFG